MRILMKMIYPSRKRIIGVTLLLYDILTILGSFWISLFISYGCEYKSIPALCLMDYVATIPIYLMVCLIVYFLFGSYSYVWRHVSCHELVIFTVAVIALSVVYFIFGRFAPVALPKRYYAIGGWIQFWFVSCSRIAPRILQYVYWQIRKKVCKGAIKKRAMLIGAGAAGQIILRDVITSDGADVEIKCVIDDDPVKWQCHMSGIPVVGGRNDIIFNVRKYNIDEILLAIPSISAEERGKILAICKETECRLRILPSVCQLVNGEVSLVTMKPVEVDDLLGRKPTIVNNDEILEQLRDKVILVTGGGGSIGSELCRQIASHAPKLLIIFDIYENNAYEIQQELMRSYPNVNLAVLIGSVRDTARIRQVFETYKPEIVFHAAAHKHVPLMEVSPYEAIKNNVLGTYKTACAAMRSGCRKFVLISTDKAVNPTNIMGASKRLCELVIQMMSKVSHGGDLTILPNFLAHHEEFSTDGMLDGLKCPVYPTEFVAVRFGNVLNSNGSIVPLFKKQIDHGGPVTVTHPDIIRYFMTIPEAVCLVLQTVAYARGGEIFVLDMGDPVKIDKLARDLIKLSGYKPDIDIKIKYIGLRPGEKLYEEMLMAEEGMKSTPNKLIYIAKPIAIDIDDFLKKLARLANFAYSNNPETIKLLKELVPTFHERNLQ